jgi:PAS domain S-box-containing protein
MDQRSPHNILVLDDDAGILALSRKVLVRAGLAVTTAQSCGEAERALTDAARGGGVSLIVLDYQLDSTITGLDFFRTLAARQLAPPAILATGFADEGRVLEALRAGVRDVIRKDDDFLERLPRAVERVLREVEAERKAFEADALRGSEERLRLALETGWLGSWELAPDTLALECSAICKVHFGLAPDAPTDSAQLLQALHPEDRERVRGEIRKLSRAGGSTDIEFRTVWPDGSTHWVLARGRMIESGPRRATRLIGVTLDVTSRKLHEQELSAAKEAAEASARQAEAASKAKDHFLAVLSHELRTPLTPILATACELSVDATLPEHARETLTMIRRNIELETKLVDDLLDLTRISRGKLAVNVRPTELRETLRSVLRMVEGELHGKGIRLRVDYAATRTVVAADPARLQQVLWNLLKNAVKFTPDGGQVSVVVADALHDQVRLEVTDTGIGIAPELLPRVFDAFEQGENAVTRQFGGLGLGLAITKALVTLHGGVISAHSEGKGHGAKFVVEWPLAAQQAALPAPRPSSNGECPSPAPGSPTGRSILLVEDHPDTSAALARLLTMFGHDVRTADSVGAAVQALESQPFDVLISDIGLPDGTGLDLMRQVRGRHSMKGIVLSGFGMEDDVRRSLEAGFATHLTKPINPDDLQAEIERLMR